MEGPSPPEPLGCWRAGELGRRRLFTGPEGGRDDRVRSHKEGSKNEPKSSTPIAGVDTVKAAADPRLTERAERKTAYEQAADLVTLLNTQMEHIRLPDLIDDARARLALLAARKARLAADLQRPRPPFDLVRSLPGVGTRRSWHPRPPDEGS